MVNYDFEGFTEMNFDEERKAVGGIAGTAIISGIIALIFGIPMLQKLLGTDEGKIKLPLGISGEWNNNTEAVKKEIIHSQEVSPSFFN